MSDETAAGSKGSIPVEEKIKMYGNRAKMEAVRIKDDDNIRKFDEAMHDTREYKRYARAKKLADLKIPCGKSQGFNLGMIARHRLTLR